jgi:hypothetical protein
MVSACYRSIHTKARKTCVRHVLPQVIKHHHNFSSYKFCQCFQQGTIPLILNIQHKWRYWGLRKRPLLIKSRFEGTSILLSNSPQVSLSFDSGAGPNDELNPLARWAWIHFAPLASCPTQQINTNTVKSYIPVVTPNYIFQMMKERSLPYHSYNLMNTTQCVHNM